MRTEKGTNVSLGYARYIRPDSMVGLEPVEMGRGPRKRTKVYIEALDEPIIASRSEGATLRDLVETPREIAKAREQYQLLGDILDTVAQISPILSEVYPFV